jgi:hypothetical protein
MITFPPSKKYKLHVGPVTGSKARAIMDIAKVCGLTTYATRHLMNLNGGFFTLCTDSCETFKTLIFTEEEASEAIKILSPNIRVDKRNASENIYGYGNFGYGPDRVPATG